MAVRTQRWEHQEHVAMLARAVVPGWVEVTVVEDWLGLRVVVTLRDTRRWWRRLLSGSRRAACLVDVACALADSPAGVAVTVGWA